MDLITFFFFFSSRRRHTRSTRDWSSDVCSSDLLDVDLAGAAAAVRAGEREPEKQPGVLTIILRPELERRRVEAHGLIERVQREGALPGLAKGKASALREGCRVLARAACELERRQVVVGEHLGAVFGPVRGQRLEPLGRQPVLLRALR